MNFIINNLFDNNLVSTCLISGIVILTTGYFITSKYLIIVTPNSPQTFNLTLEELREIDNVFEEADMLDQDFDNMIGEQGYNNFNPEFQLLDENYEIIIEDILNIF